MESSANRVHNVIEVMPDAISLSASIALILLSIYILVSRYIRKHYLN